jgi:hypothetical protein
VSRRRDEGPRPLDETLSSLAKRVRRVNLTELESVRVVWGDVAPKVLADKCLPVLLKGGTLVVEVPSGAFAQRVREDSSEIIRELHRRGFLQVVDISAVVGAVGNPGKSQNETPRPVD